MLGDKVVSLIGRVQHGQKRGSEFGFPTANLVCELPEEITFGVYLSKVSVEAGEPIFALTNIGFHPTVGSSDFPLVESYLLEKTGDLYGKIIEVHLLEFLRGEKEFNSIAELKKQISFDVETANDLIALYKKSV